MSVCEEGEWEGGGGHYPFSRRDKECHLRRGGWEGGEGGGIDGGGRWELGCARTEHHCTAQPPQSSRGNEAEKKKTHELILKSFSP